MCYCASHQPIAVQADSTLSTACENDTRLKKWQIGVIVLGVVIVVGACRSFVGSPADPACQPSSLLLASSSSRSCTNRGSVARGAAECSGYDRTTPRSYTHGM